jgi:diguanylate cyclase (GGDEF)-like protein/PAS domain S-box-containing protein
MRQHANEVKVVNRQLKAAMDELERRQAELARLNTRLQDLDRAKTEAAEALRKSAAEIEDLYESAPCGYHSLDREGTLVRINQTELNWLGYTKEEVVGRMKFSDLLTPASRRSCEQDFLRLQEQGAVHGLEYEMMRKDGSLLPVLLSATAITDADGNYLMSRSTVFDYSERKRDEDRLRQAATVFANTNDAIMVTDPDRNVVAVNQAFTRITGFAAEEVMGRNPRFQKSGRQDEAFYQEMWRTLEASGQWQGEIWNQRKNGEIYPAWENISVVKDEQGRAVNYISIFSDISTVKEAEERMTRLAHHDALTDLPNRLLFTARLDQALEREKRRGHKIGLLLLDLDRFKLVNDTLGHAVGDRLLQVVAQRLKRCVRAADTVARLGGDEFIIILDEIAHAQDAALVATKISDELAEPITLDGRQVVTSASIGISIYPDDVQSAQDLVKAADAAMYRAKERGRHTFEFYTAELTARAQRHLTLEGELRQALAAGEFLLHYQPQFDLATGRIVGVEALLRWRHPTRGLTLPDEFIPIAEESGLIEPIGEWVIDEAFAQAAAWSAQGLAPTRVAVNLSARQMLYDHVIAIVERALRKHAVEPNRIQLEIEITESVLLSAERSAAMLRRLRALGVSIAIDDFGTGYSSLSHLKHLPVDTLKIGHVFIQHIPADLEDKAIASTIISIGRHLGLRVVAEGVETHEQLAFLREQRCNEVQGHLLCEALDASEVTRVLRRGRVDGLARGEQVLGCTVPR